MRAGRKAPKPTNNAQLIQREERRQELAGLGNPRLGSPANENGPEGPSHSETLGKSAPTGGQRFFFVAFAGFVLDDLAALVFFMVGSLVSVGRALAESDSRCDSRDDNAQRAVVYSSSAQG